jgi:hypothetical protein
MDIENATKVEELKNQALRNVSTGLAKEESDVIQEERPKEELSRRVGKKHSFHISHTFSNGTEVSGRFTNQILTISQQVAVGALRAQLTGSLPYDSLDPTTRNLSEMMAHLSISLTDKPKWALDIASMDDIGLIAKIYEEVASHEAMFRENRSTD